MYVYGSDDWYFSTWQWSMSLEFHWQLSNWVCLLLVQGLAAVNWCAIILNPPQRYHKRQTKAVEIGQYLNDGLEPTNDEKLRILFAKVINLPAWPMPSIELASNQYLIVRKSKSYQVLVCESYCLQKLSTLFYRIEVYS